MTKKIKMITRLGGDEIVVGECSSAQARILAKKEHAKFVDGKLLVSIRPFHLDLAVNNIADGFSMAARDPNVSDAELERRLDWFRGLMGTGTLAQLPRGSDLEAILSVNRGFETVHHLWKLSPEETKAMSPEALRFHRVHFISGGVELDAHLAEPLTDEWVDSLFVDDDRWADEDFNCQTHGHREVPEEVWLEEEDDLDDYRNHVVVHKAAFNFKGASVNRGVHDYEAAA